MNRRDFLRTSAGFLTIPIATGVWRCVVPNWKVQNVPINLYRDGKTFGKVFQITPSDSYYIHTFFDVCPFSPSEKFVAVTKIPFQDHPPIRGEMAEVCVIDMEKWIIRKVYKTKGWGFQLGANLNWGKTDRFLYTNDIIGNEAVCVRIDLDTQDVFAFSGPMYHIAPDESCVIGFPLDLVNETQGGYGVPNDPNHPPFLPPGASSVQGIWRTDLRTNKKILLVSVRDVFLHLQEKSYYIRGTFYFAHTKFNRQNTRIMQVLRCVFPDQRKIAKHVFTFNSDGSQIQQAVSRELWSRMGHHPNWHPNGDDIVMNLALTENELRFCKIRYDGTDIQILSKRFLGSGHPSIDITGRYLVSDAYPHEPVAFANEEVPIRLIDLKNDIEETICTIYTLGKGKRELRCDPHPAWSRDGKKVCFNGAPNGKRQVFIADLSNQI